MNSTQRFGSSLELNVHQHSIYLDGVYITRGPTSTPTFQPAAPLTAQEVERVHTDEIARIRRVLARYDLNPIQLGLPPRPGATEASEHSESGDPEQLFLDFGDAQDGPFFPSLKAASIKSKVPFGEREGRGVRTLRDPDIARAYESSGWTLSTHVPPPLVLTEGGFSLHGATLIKAGDRA